MYIFKPIIWENLNMPENLNYKKNSNFSDCNTSKEHVVGQRFDYASSHHEFYCLDQKHFNRNYTRIL